MLPSRQRASGYMRTVLQFFNAAAQCTVETVKVPRAEGGCCLREGGGVQELENESVGCEVIIARGGGHLKAEEGGGDVTDKK